MRPSCILLGALAAVPSAALSCSVPDSPIERVRRDYDAVVIATVEGSGYTEPAPGMRPWRASARLNRTLYGKPNANNFVFGRTGSSALCDDGQAPPRVGDKWVLYLSDDRGQLEVYSSYPLSLAHKIDPRFQQKEPAAAKVPRYSLAWVAALLLVIIAGAMLWARRRQNR